MRARRVLRWLLPALVACLTSCARPAPPLPSRDVSGRAWAPPARPGPRLILFWAPWSPLSRPQLAAAREAAAGGAIELIAVALDPSGGTAAREILANSATPFPNLLGSADTVRDWDGLELLPAVARIDARGRLVGWHRGFVDADGLARLVP